MLRLLADVVILHVTLGGLGNCLVDLDGTTDRDTMDVAGVFTTLLTSCGNTLVVTCASYDQYLYAHTPYNKFMCQNIFCHFAPPMCITLILIP